MKLQYRYYDVGRFKWKIELYCDGRILEVITVWEDELFEKLDELQEQGFTIGYTAKEINEAKERYERMLANIISKEINT